MTNILHKTLSNLKIETLFKNNEQHYSETSPLGPLNSGDTNFGPGKMFTLSLYLLPLMKGHLYSGERDTFSGSQNPSLTSIQGTP